MNPKLRQRVITAIGIGIVLIPLLLLSNLSAKILFGLILFFMLFEYFRLAYAGKSGAFAYLFSGIVLSAITCWAVIAYGARENVLLYTLSAIIILAIANVFILIQTNNVWISRGFFSFQALYYLTIPLSSIILFLDLVENFRFILFCIFIVIWISDSAAYSIGSRYGKRKLAEKVSPNKTWAGFWGAGLFSLITVVVISLINLQVGLKDWIVLGILIWIFGSLGDLVESSIKRHFKVKDTGNIMPGHGGFLDRFDSFVFSMPFILFYFEVCL